MKIRLGARSCLQHLEVLLEGLHLGREEPVTESFHDDVTVRHLGEDRSPRSPAPPALSPLSALNTTHVHAFRSPPCEQLQRVPPQPISMSSLCAPMKSTRLRPRLTLRQRERQHGIATDPSWRVSGTRPRSRCRSPSLSTPGSVPMLARSLSGQRGARLPTVPFRSRVHLIESLLVLERVHASPRTRCREGRELAGGDEPPKWLLDQLLAVLM